MFTGIIEEVGEVAALEPAGDSAVLTVAAHTVADDLSHGASIAVNGVCLTVVGWDAAGIRLRRHGRDAQALGHRRPRRAATG